MTTLLSFLHFFLHLDVYLNIFIQQFGAWTYVIIFFIIFCETGLVVTPFLPGDSLLFAAGAFAALDSLNIWWLLTSLIVAAILGDAVNYWIGHTVGQKAFSGKYERFFKKEYLERTQGFYLKYGAKTIVLARFLPILRTFAPFVAGIGSMPYGTFLAYNAVGSVAWVLLFTGGGYLFGNVPFVKEHFSLVVIGIIILSVLMGVGEYVRVRVMGLKKEPIYDKN